MSTPPLLPPADLEAWRALALKSLKGEPFERLISKTRDGLEIQPLYPEAPDGPRLGARAAPGADATRPWDLRALITVADPATANRQALEALNAGAASIELALDAKGEKGVAVGGLDDLARALDGVLLDLAPVALDAGWMGPQAANWLAVLAKGAPEAPLAFNLDPLSAFLETGESPGPVSAHVEAAAQAGARHASAYPRASLFLASGRAVHEAGGTEGQALGVMAASAVAYLKALDAAGLSTNEALDRIVLGASTDQHYPLGIAATRAARAVWARIAQACGADQPARISVRGSRRMLTAKGAWNNLLRQTAAVFAAGVGGADIVAIDPFTWPLGGDNALARRQARNIQLVLMEEASLARVADPAGGSSFFEATTYALAETGWAFFQKIEAEGGLAAALTSGLVQDAVEASRDALMADIAAGQAPMLGVDLFPDPSERLPALDAHPTTSVTPPDVRQAGGADRCRPLSPIRLSETLEAAA